MYIPDIIEVAERLGIEILESRVSGSRLHQILNNPYDEGIDEG
jgi:hypothetical protein